MSSCRYPKCRSTDIQIIYLGKPLCSKHWEKIASMPLEKAAGLLKITRPAPAARKTADPFELKASLESVAQAAPEAQSKKKNSGKKAAPVKKKASAKKKVSSKKPAGIRSVTSAKQAASAKPVDSAQQVEEQQSLFG